MRFACRITKATDTHSELVLILGFPRQQWLRERASLLRYTYIVSVVTFFIRRGNNSVRDLSTKIR